MPYHHLKRLKGTDPLAELFNAYLKGLSTPAMMCEPTYTTMAEVRSLYDKLGRARERNLLRHCARRYYELTVLRNSLHSIHAHVLAAITTLEEFFTTYAGDVTAYALANRVRTLQEYGSEDDSDWEEDGSDEQGQPRWKVAYKDDPDTLREYGLWDTLGSYFGRGDTRGEYIGTSGPSDFYPYSTLVAEQSTFSFRKMLEAIAPGKEVAIVRLSEDGTTTPMGLGDHLEAELNEDLAGAELVRRFNVVLLVCSQLGSLYRQMKESGPVPFQKLLEALRLVRDVQADLIE